MDTVNNTIPILYKETSFQKYSFVIIIVLAVVIIGMVYNNYMMNKTQEIIKQELAQTPKIEQTIQKVPIVAPTKPSITNVIQPPKEVIVASPPRDLLKDLDYRVLNDPLVESTSRPPRHVIGPVIYNPHFNYPTRGFTDSFSLKGYLTLADSDASGVEKENRILKLFGREKYPNSPEWEYYAMINTGYNDSIKYSLEKQRRELYSGDKVYIDLLKKNYVVEILKSKTFEYNPYEI